MTDFLKMVSTLREQMTANLSRSDVLRPLAWLIAILVSCLIGLAWAKASSGPITLVSTALALSIIIYLGAYVYCLVTDRDALRSEKYSLSKMAIEHGLYGDSTIGIIDPSATPGNALALPNASAKAEGSE